MHAPFETEAEAPSSAEPASTLERRLRAEWQLLVRLAAANPGRLTQLEADDLTLRCVLRGTPARLLDGTLRSEHSLRIAFPFTFPAAPLELSLAKPVAHPNIHPVTGFICLWEMHRRSHTTEHALLKTEAMLGARLWNRRAEHVMQPAALLQYETEGKRLAEEPAVSPLRAVTSFEPEMPSKGLRRRLS